MDIRRFLTRVSPSVVLFLFFFALYTFTMSGWIQYGDEVEKYRVAQSMVERHDFSFRPTAMYRTVGVDNRTYSTYELGQSILEVPFYALGRVIYSFYPQPDVNWTGMLFVGLLNPLLTALTCVTLFKVCHELGFRYRTSVALTVLFGLATIAWPYAKGFTREPLLGLLILLTFYATYRFSKTNQTRWLLVAAVLTGYLVFSKFLQGMVIPFFAAYIAVSVFQTRKQINQSNRSALIAALQSVAVYLLPGILFIGLQGLYAWVRFGTLTLGVAGTRNNLITDSVAILSGSHPLATGIRVLLSPEKSIFLYSPPILLFLIALPKWFRTQAKEALLLLGLILVAVAISLVRPDGDGGSWWGPRYLVQITALLIIPLGMLESSRFSHRGWKILFGLLVALGVFVQVVGVLGNDRDYLDTSGNYSSLAGQIDFLRHGAIDSLVISLSLTGSPLQINSFGILLGAIVLVLGFAIAWRMRRSVDERKSSSRLSWAFLTLILLIEFGGFVGWIVAPYAQVLAAKGNTRYVAASRFLADDRKCEATAMYLMALDWQTTYQQQAAERIEQLLPRAKGELMAIDDPMHWIEAPEGTSIEDDPSVTITGDDSVRFSAPVGKDVDVSISSGPIRVLPNTQYELSGWTKGEALYGTGYGVISIFEDNGNWEDGRTTDIQAMDETRGWQPFRGSITTLPTTRRFFVKAGLYKTYGTLWVDGVQLIQVDPNAPRAAVTLPPCER